MTDKAHRNTDKILSKLEKHIKQEYTKAYREVKEELQKIMMKLDLNPDMPPAQRLLLANKKDRLTNLAKVMADVIKNANAEAVKYINNDMVNVYKLNYDFAGEELGFSVLDKTAVKNILKEEANPFTKLAIDAEKDANAIRRKLTSELTTSLLKGESIPQMAKRIKGVTERSLADSVRIARTETTRVEAQARYDVGKKGEEMGFTMMKRWVATTDDRTRPEHNSADGQEVPLDEPFIVGGEKMMFPADFSLGASPWNTINCRCTMINVIKEDGKTEK